MPIASWAMDNARSQFPSYEGNPTRYPLTMQLPRPTSSRVPAHALEPLPTPGTPSTYIAHTTTSLTP